MCNRHVDRQAAGVVDHWTDTNAVGMTDNGQTGIPITCRPAEIETLI